jgi:hypothetical protein
MFWPPISPFNLLSANRKEALGWKIQCTLEKEHVVFPVLLQLIVEYVFLSCPVVGRVTLKLSQEVRTDGSLSLTIRKT